MKETIRKNIVDLPYSLHDAKVNKMKIQEENIVLHFGRGFYKPANNDCLPVKGAAAISIQGLDLDFCHAYILDTAGGCGKITGEKISLEEFVNRFADIDFEILDETYGYNQSNFSGYLYNAGDIKECIIEMYHLGDMRYITED